MVIFSVIYVVFLGGGEGWGEVVSILLQLLEYLPFYVLVEKFHVS